MPGLRARRRSGCTAPSDCPRHPPSPTSRPASSPRSAPKERVDAEPDTNVALRWILLAIGIAQIAVAIPALIFGTDAGLPVHAARHIGSFDVALGVGFLYAAWRPSRIPGLLPVVAALVACLVASSFLDVASGSTAALGEAQHVLDFVGLAVVWLLSRPAARRVQLAP